MFSALKAASYAQTHVNPVPEIEPSSIVALTWAVLERLEILFVVPETVQFFKVAAEEAML